MTKTKNKKVVSVPCPGPVVYSTAEVKDIVFTSDPQESNAGKKVKIMVEIHYLEDDAPTTEQIRKAAKSAINRLCRSEIPT